MGMHLEIGKAGFDVLFAIINPEPFRDNPPFKHIPLKHDKKSYGTIQLLDNSYNERVGSMRGDEYVLMYVPKGRGEEIYEIHFNYKNQINKVYLVM